MSVSIRITHDIIPALMAGAGAKAAAVVAKTVADIESRAKAAAPVDTGNLRNSIQGRAAGLSGQVSVGAEYGIYVEFGTRKMSAQPYFVPAVEAVRGPFLAAMRSVVAP